MSFMQVMYMLLVNNAINGTLIGLDNTGEVYNLLFTNN